MPHHLKNDCKTRGRLYKFLLRRRNRISSFYMESSFPNLVTGVFFVCNLHSEAICVWKCIIHSLSVCSQWWLANSQLKYVLFEKNGKSPIHSHEGMSWAVGRLNQVLPLALKATWLSAGPWGGSFVLGSRVVVNVCLHTSAYAGSV